jgi:hypothetical protein
MLFRTEELDFAAAANNLSISHAGLEAFGRSTGKLDF